MSNRFGNSFSFTSFGESHSVAIGGVIDGVPAGLTIDLDMIREELNRRGGRRMKEEGRRIEDGTSPRARREKDEVEWLSGVFEGKTLGTPIAFLIRNTDARPEDYEVFRHTFRTGHADRVYQLKYGIRDHRGGGRASARETAGRVVAGAMAKQVLAQKGIHIHAHVAQIGREVNPAHFDEEIKRAAAKGDSVGGIITCTITGLPVGIGEPIFDKLQSHLAYAIMSINGCKGFDYGSGFEGVDKLGSEINGVSGGISGGISDGTPLTFRCVFRPTPSTRLQAKKDGLQATSGEITLRTDICFVPRAVPIVEAMAALVISQVNKL
ncbi:MAG: chorismate synthase [Paludibacteraceae bacterium]|nr:chorismate synthase [Paludibacteraceae bacterium]